MVKILSILFFCLNALTSCGQFIESRGPVPRDAASTSNPNPNAGIPQSALSWDGKSMVGTKQLRVIPID